MCISIRMITSGISLDILIQREAQRAKQAVHLMLWSIHLQADADAEKGPTSALCKSTSKILGEDSTLHKSLLVLHG